MTVASMRSWAAHTRGVAQLIQLRGPEQFRTKASLGLFLQLRRLTVMNSFPPQDKASITNFDSSSPTVNCVALFLTASARGQNGRKRYNPKTKFQLTDLWKSSVISLAFVPRLKQIRDQSLIRKSRNCCIWGRC
jgi:hypothetical protein